MFAVLKDYKNRSLNKILSTNELFFDQFLFVYLFSKKFLKDIWK